MPILYVRSTREVDLGALSPLLRGAIEAYAGKHQLVLQSTRCFLTHSENPPAAGFFGRMLGSRANSADPDKEHDSALLLHPTHLVMATSGEKRGTTALGLPLDQASVQRGSMLASLAGMAPAEGPHDDGITVSGLPGMHGRPGTYFFGLGAPGADACFAAVESAIRARKNP